MRLLLLLLLLLGQRAFAQQVHFVDREWITSMKNNRNDTVYVINFWATWCQPCVAEIPQFEKLHASHLRDKVKVIMVSCDFSKQVNSRVKPFVAKRKMKAYIAFMNESNPDNWVGRVDPAWQGDIPATWIICGAAGYRKFFSGETTFEALESYIKPIKK
jgi:thiol-disulfide isomerase/thioredoxin